MTDSPTTLASPVLAAPAADPSPDTSADTSADPSPDTSADTSADPLAVQSTAYPTLLDALHETVAPGRLVASATGHVLASRAALPLAPDSGLTRFGVAWINAGPLPDSAIGARVSNTKADRERFGRGLLDLHCDLLRGALRHGMRWLDGRTAEGSSLLARQLNQGASADAAVQIAECEAMCADLDGAGPEIRWLISRRLTATGRGLLDLLGAAGFLSDGVAAELYLAELTGNVYLHPGTENEDAHVD
jgi:hypothetical protein